ncbi:hypothetical protein [Microbacterium sp. 179-I 3D4 NHS]|uniref:hypothetical protein n=1 Tax=Microbacterium sp. 179-I 3D4 NHS TaxID=3142381 RepID=UPI0039A0DC28
MDWTGILWTAVGAVLGVAAQLLVDRMRHTHDDYELWCDVLPWGDMRERGLDQPSGAPVVDLFLWNAGRRDITEDQFDRGRPLVIHLGTRILGTLPGGHWIKVSPESVSIHPEGTIQIAPGLLRRGMVVHLRLAVSAFPSLSFDNPIAHVAEVRSAVDLPPHRLSSRVQSVIGWAAIVAVGAALGFAYGLIARGGGYPWLPFPDEVQFVLAGVIVAIPVGALVLLHVSLTRGPDRALFVLHEAVGEETVEIGMSRRRWWEGRTSPPR